MRLLKVDIFHATDAKNVDSIVENGFFPKKNPNHWLGNGVYFFVDETLAEWWTTNPSKKFGNKISSPAIIQCILDLPDDSILDLRKLTDYRYCFDMFNYFCNHWFFPYAKTEQIPVNRLRCLFFDWMFDINEYSAIIGTFLSSDQPYYGTMRRLGSRFETLNLSYSEVQVCVQETRQNLIIDKQVKLLDNTN